MYMSVNTSTSVSP